MVKVHSFSIKGAEGEGSTQDAGERRSLCACHCEARRAAAILVPVKAVKVFNAEDAEDAEKG